jgi:hypothetical protein
MSLWLKKMSLWLKKMLEKLLQISQMIVHFDEILEMWLMTFLTKRNLYGCSDSNSSSLKIAHNPVTSNWVSLISRKLSRFEFVFDLDAVTHRQTIMPNVTKMAQKG